MKTTASEVRVALLVSIFVLATESQGSGNLAFLQVMRNGAGGVTGIGSATLPGFSPDGRHLYVPNNTGSGGVAIFTRDTVTGLLTFVQSVQYGEAPYFAAVTSDGSSVYTDGSGGYWVFDRDPVTGAISFPQEYPAPPEPAPNPEQAFSADGNYRYSVIYGSSELHVHQKDTNTGLFTILVETHTNGVNRVKGMRGARGIVMAPDGGHVYVTGNLDYGLAVFGRDPGTGRLRWLEALQSTGSAGQFGVSRKSESALGLGGVREVQISPDGMHVYTTSPFEGAVSVFRRVSHACSSAPMPSCRAPFVGHVGSFKIDATRAQIAWKWIRGQATTQAELGDPVVGLTDHALCVYDGSAAPQPVFSATIPAGGYCGAPGCWKSLPSGDFKYADRGVVHQGMRQIRLHAGGDGQAKITVQGGGDHAGLPTLPLVTAVRVQLQSSNGGCWGATYSAPTVNTATAFRAVAD